MPTTNEIRNNSFLHLLHRSSNTTTVLRSGENLVISGILSGDILLNNKKYTDLEYQFIRQNIALVFQENELFSSTVYENVAYRLHEEGIDEEEVEHEVVRMLQFVNLEDAIQKTCFISLLCGKFP